MKGATNITPYSGNPKDLINSPAHGRVDALVKQYGGPMKTEISRLPDKQTYVEGLDGKLIKVNSFEEIKGGKVVRMPSEESVDAVVKKVIEQVQAEVPEIYQPGVIEALKELKPQYANQS